MGTTVAPKFKVNLVSGAIGKPAVAFTGVVTYDFTSRDATSVNFTVSRGHCGSPTWCG
jgi:hypothetical protein